MPFRSVKQERFMWAKHPDIAKRWEAEFGDASSGQGQRHKAHSDFRLNPGPRRRHTPFRATEQEATRDGPIELVGHGGPLGAAVSVSGYRGRDVRAAATAKVRKGKHG